MADQVEMKYAQVDKAATADQVKAQIDQLLAEGWTITELGLSRPVVVQPA